MSKQTKRILATIVDKRKAGDFKRLAIESELCAQQASNAPLKIDKSLKE